MRGERRHSRVFPCQRWELGWVQARGSRGGREGCLESTIMPRLQWAKLGRRPRRLTNAQSSPVNGFHGTHPLVLSLSLSLSPSLSPTLPPSCTYALSLPLAFSKALALSPPHLSSAQSMLVKSRHPPQIHTLREFWSKLALFLHWQWIFFFFFYAVQPQLIYKVPFLISFFTNQNASLV